GDRGDWRRLTSGGSLVLILGRRNFWPCAIWRRRTRLQHAPGTARKQAVQGARSSAVEHYLDMVGVTGSIPVAPTIFLQSHGSPKRLSSRVEAADRLPTNCCAVVT